MKKKRLKITAILLQRILLQGILLLGILLLGAAWQYMMEQIEEEEYTAPGGYVNVGTYDMHYVSKGEGETAVLFITGSGTPCAYTDFYRLQEALSLEAQTISFDHAGSGWSSGTDAPRTAENLEQELTILLDAVAPQKQVILVCHSLGSLEALYFAQCHPEKVRGMVFLDSGDPDFYRTDSELAAILLNRGTALTRVTGLNRLLGAIGLPLPFYGENHRLQRLPEEIQGMDRAMFYRHAGSSETLKSIGEMNENAQAVLDGPRLDPIPMLVLSSDSGDAWGSVQESLAGWSDDSRQVTIENAEHYLHWSNPEEVLQQIVSFVDEIRDMK